MATTSGPAVELTVGAVGDVEHAEKTANATDAKYG